MQPTEEVNPCTTIQAVKMRKCFCNVQGNPHTHTDECCNASIWSGDPDECHLTPRAPTATSYLAGSNGSPGCHSLRFLRLFYCMPCSLAPPTKTKSQTMSWPSSVYIRSRARMEVDSDSDTATHQGAARSTSATVLYASTASEAPTVRLFTRAGCTLCDKAKDVLREVAKERPHTLEAVNIVEAGNDHWWRRYKFDIPVLHINGQYWAKHRVTLEESLEALAAAQEG